MWILSVRLPGRYPLAIMFHKRWSSKIQLNLNAATGVPHNYLRPDHKCIHRPLHPFFYFGLFEDKRSLPGRVGIVRCLRQVHSAGDVHREGLVVAITQSSRCHQFVNCLPTSWFSRAPSSPNRELRNCHEISGDQWLRAVDKLQRVFKAS